jgi:hypothetical protein
VLAGLPLAFGTAHTSTLLLHAGLVVRGIGLGCSVMPTMASALSRLDPGQVPRATSALNTLQRVGGSLGTALLAVILQRETRSALEPATAFAHTFVWALAISLLAVVAAGLLAWSELRGRAARTRPVHPAQIAP